MSKYACKKSKSMLFNTEKISLTNDVIIKMFSFQRNNQCISPYAASQQLNQHHHNNHYGEYSKWSSSGLWLVISPWVKHLPVWQVLSSNGIKTNIIDWLMLTISTVKFRCYSAITFVKVMLKILVIQTMALAYLNWILKYVMWINLRRVLGPGMSGSPRLRIKDVWHPELRWPRCRPLLRPILPRGVPLDLHPPQPEQRLCRHLRHHHGRLQQQQQCPHQEGPHSCTQAQEHRPQWVSIRIIWINC